MEGANHSKNMNLHSYISKSKLCKLQSTQLSVLGLIAATCFDLLTGHRQAKYICV